jgi:hypothetical protein
MSPQGPIRLAIRLASGALGLFFVALAVFAFLSSDRSQRIGGPLMVLLGGLFLLPALFSGPRPASRTVESQAFLVRTSAVVAYSSLILGILLLFAASRTRLSWPSGLPVGAALWLFGFVMLFFHAYYSRQD